MKNTELVQVKGIMEFKEELEKVKPLTLEKYTITEAAKYFGCAKSQIKGYHTNYRDLFGDNIVVEGVEGRQKTIINKDAMFLMAILLNKKSKVAEQVFKNVLNLVINKDQVTLDEVAATVKEEAYNKEEKEVTSKTNNVINIEDLRKAKKDSDTLTCIKVKITPEGTEITPVELKNKEAKQLMKNKKFNPKNEIPEELVDLLSGIASEIAGTFEEESCRCPECLEEELVEAYHEADMEKLLVQSTLETEVIFTKNYMEKCELLGMDKLDAAIMIQSSIINGDMNIDSKILNYLIDEKRAKINKDMGIIQESVRLLAEEKFDSLKEAYIVLAQEMRYELGQDLTEFARQEEYSELVKVIVANDEFCSAMNIIHTYLSE